MKTSLSGPLNIYLTYISNIFLGLESVYGQGLFDFSPFWILNGCLNSFASCMSEVVFFLLMWTVTNVPTFSQHGID